MGASRGRLLNWYAVLALTVNKPAVSTTETNGKGVAPLDVSQIRENIEALTRPGTAPDVRRIALALKEHISGKTSTAKIYDELRRVTR